MDRLKLDNAKNEAKKALKWIILSGSALTALSAIASLLTALQTGVNTFQQFVTGVVFTLGFMIINTGIYAIGQYKEPTE